MSSGSAAKPFKLALLRELGLQTKSGFGIFSIIEDISVVIQDQTTDCASESSHLVGIDASSMSLM